MRTGIHPKYNPQAVVICSCSNTWTTGSTRDVLHTDRCFKCHPFFTGEQRMSDTEGQVDRFYKKLEIRDQFRAAANARETFKVSPDQPVTTLELGARAESALAQVGLHTIAQLLDKLSGGDDALIAIEGFGRKSLIDLKKRLRARGFLAEVSEEPAPPAAA